MSSITRHRSSLAFPILLCLMAVVRLHVPYVRLGFSIVVEWGVIVLCSILTMKYVNRWAGGFLLACLFHTIFPEYSKLSFLAMYAVLIGVAWYSAVVLVKPSREQLLNAICVIALINLLFVVLQAISGNEHFPKTGLMANVNETSALFGISVAAFLRPKWWVGLIGIGIGLLLTKSNGGVFAAIVACSAFSISKKMYWPILIMVLVGVLYVLFVDFPGYGFRLHIWSSAFSWWTERPTGWGLGHFKAVVIWKEWLSANAARPITAHNEFVQLLVEAPFALLAVVGYLSFVWKRAKASPLMCAAVAGVAASSFVHFTFHIGTTAIIGATLLAMVEYGQSDSLVGDLRGSRDGRGLV